MVEAPPGTEVLETETVVVVEVLVLEVVAVVLVVLVLIAVLLELELVLVLEALEVVDDEVVLAVVVTWLLGRHCEYQSFW